MFLFFFCWFFFSVYFEAVELEVDDVQIRATYTFRDTLILFFSLVSGY